MLDVPVEEGSAVSPVTAVTGGTLLLSLAATSTLHLEGLVDENEVARVAVGQPARIRTEAFGERAFAGRVRKISPVGQRIQNVTYFEVEVEVTDADGAALRPRMSGDAEIVTEVVEDALRAARDARSATAASRSTWRPGTARPLRAARRRDRHRGRRPACRCSRASRRATRWCSDDRERSAQ